MQVAHRTDVGRRRQRNEDALLEDRSRRLFVVADGMGGHPAGDVASRTTVDLLDRELDVDSRSSDGARMRELCRSLVDADEVVRNEGVDDPSKEGMGTTAVVATLSEDERLLTVAHIGDSRAYVLRGDKLYRITEDHVADSALGRVLTQAIGASDHVEPEAAEVDIEPGDRVLLCTDGLTDMLSDEEIHGFLAQDCSPDECCEQLLAAALDRGGDDNITLIVIDPDPS